MSVSRFSLVAITVAAATALEVQGGQPEPFQDLRRETQQGKAKFCWQSESYSYVFRENGAVRRFKPDDTKGEALRIAITAYGAINRLWVKPYQGDLLIHAEVESGGNAGGTICRYRENPWSKRWCQSFPSFNNSASTSDDGSIYIGGMNFIGQIDAGTGRFNWSHRKIGNGDQGFEVADLAVEKDAMVYFQVIGLLPDRMVAIAVDRNSGKTEVVDAYQTPDRDRAADKAYRNLGRCASMR